MLSAISQPALFKLSICITTFNRATFIGETLESILTQLTNDCEVVVLDGGSTDDTERVVSEYARRFERLRYIRQDTNNGFDCDCDRVVELASGQYCWLMTDDDQLKPGAVAAVLQALCRDLSLVIVNMEIKNLDMSKLLQPCVLDFESNRVYGPEETDRLFTEVGDHLQYVGCVVIRRAIWLGRERQRYYGSWFIHLGVIFQERLPREALVIAEPFISYRASNAHSWSSQIASIDLFFWPSIVGSLPLSESTKRVVESVQPWRHPQWLLVLRGAGFYSLGEYHRYITPQLRSMQETLAPILVAVLPGMLVNAFLLLYYSIRRDGRLQWMKDSRFYFRNWRVFKPRRGVPTAPNTSTNEQVGSPQ